MDRSSFSSLHGTQRGEKKQARQLAGLYITGEDKYRAVVRVNVQAANLYQAIYHEYAHALVNLNFDRLPLWLSEGIAEFLGNSRMHKDFVEIGGASPHHLAVLRENKLIPVLFFYKLKNKRFFGELSTLQFF